ncbi:MAG: CapA family protein [Candidatus Saccharimonas sp.]
MKLLAIIILVLLVVGGAAAWGLWSHRPEKIDQSSTSSDTKLAPHATPESLSSLMMFTGNSFWGRYTRDAANKTDNPAQFPFARLHEFDRDKYDAWMTGVECPTTQGAVDMSSKDMEATLTFNCDPSYLPEFAKWFTAVTLANNHTDNMGVDGFSETQTALAKNGIQYFGHYDPENLDNLCDVISLPVRATLSDGSIMKGKLPVAMCGYHGVFKIPSSDSVSVISKYTAIMPVFVMAHSGAEYQPAADTIKQNSYRSMIDAGADMVLGDHPHWVQNTEDYKGKLIVYSMGNFMFDQQWGAEVTRSAAIVVDATVDKSDASQLAGWLKLGETCAGYHDSCLAEAKAQGLKKLDLKYKFDFVATDDTGYQTHPAPELRSGIEKRLNWDKTMQALGQ